MTSISAERAGLEKYGVRLRRREEWGAKRSYTDAREVNEPADYQFVHISITNPWNYGSDDAHARAIEAIGIARFPNTGISYNRLFFRSGAAYEGQPVGRRGAHTVNDKQLSTCNTSGCPSRTRSLRRRSTWNLNYNVRSYVVAQNVGDSVTDAQLDAMARVMAADRLAGFVRMDADIHGHRCVAWKDCPAGHMWARMAELKALVAHYVTVLAAGGTPIGEDWFDVATKQELKDALSEVLIAHAQSGTALQAMVRQQAANGVDQALDGANVPAKLREILWLGTKVKRGINPDGTPVYVSALQELADSKTAAVKAAGLVVDEAEIAASVGAILLPIVQSAVTDALAEVDGVDEQAVAKAVVDEIAGRLASTA